MFSGGEVFGVKAVLNRVGVAGLPATLSGLPAVWLESRFGVVVMLKYPFGGGRVKIEHMFLPNERIAYNP